MRDQDKLAPDIRAFRIDQDPFGLIDPSNCDSVFCWRHTQLVNKNMKTHEELGIEAAQCGHYPRLTTRLPLWLRLEVGDQDVDIGRVIRVWVVGEDHVNPQLMWPTLVLRDKLEHPGEFSWESAEGAVKYPDMNQSGESRELAENHWKILKVS